MLAHFINERYQSRSSQRMHTQASLAASAVDKRYCKSLHLTKGFNQW